MEPDFPQAGSPGPGFRDAVAVEVWDACFRWREHGRVMDATVAATWARVAKALAHDGEPDTFARDLVDALAWLRLLPDARLLATLGTGRPANIDACDVAVVNAAAFVRDPFGERARVDIAGLESVAGLAVRLLDRARVHAGAARGGGKALRVGLIGVGDALQRLGLPYDSDAGRGEAARIAAALAAGTLEASLAAVAAGAAPVPRLRYARAMAAELRCRPAAHASLTAITPQPLLALLGDNVADALDPCDSQPRAHRITAPGGERIVRSRGGTAMLARELGVPESAAAPWPPSRAQVALRAAVAPWIDEPVDYPLATSHPDAIVRQPCPLPP
jgi:hypothetical protein